MKAIKSPQSLAQRTIASAVCAMMLLSGCATDRSVTNMSRNAEDKSDQALQLPANKGDVVVRHNQAYLIGDAVSVAAPVPDFLRQQTLYHSAIAVPLSTVTSYITSETGIAVDISALSTTSAGLGVVLGGVYPKVQVNYAGPLSGLLDVLANEAGAFWRASDGKIIFYRTITKTFWLSTAPRKSTDTSTVSSVSGAGASNGGSSGTSGASASATSGSGTSGGSSGLMGSSSTGGISAENTYTLDAWSGIEKTAHVVGGSAQVAVDATSGAITVTGAPADVLRVGEWVDGLNSYYGQQVEVEMHVYNVQLSSEDNYSLSPSIVYKAAGATTGYSLTSLAAPAVQGLSNPAAFALSKSNNSVTGQSTAYNGTNAAVAALSTLGRVVQTYAQTQVTTNGHPTVMQTGNSISYLYSVSNLATANVGSSSTLTPGVINTGLTTLVMPKIAGGTIHLGVTMTNSNLVSISSATSNGSSIQTPDVSSTNVQQDVILHPGDALLLTSLRGEKGTSTHNGTGSPMNPLLGGGVDATASKSLIAVVITAKVL